MDKSKSSGYWCASHEHHTSYLKTRLEASEKQIEALRLQIEKLERERDHYMSAYLKEKALRMRDGKLQMGRGA